MTSDQPPTVGPADRTSRTAARWLDEHGDALYRFARSRVGQRELAEDLVQDTFLAALRAHHAFQGASSVRTWLLAILRRKIVDHYRHASAGSPARTATAGDAGSTEDRERPRFFTDRGTWRKEHAPAAWKTPLDLLEKREFWDVLDRCLDRLPRPLARAFVLRELEGLGIDELGRALTLRSGNIRVRLHRARLLLRECLERHWFHPEPPRTS